MRLRRLDLELVQEEYAANPASLTRAGSSLKKNSALAMSAIEPDTGGTYGR